MAKQTFTTGQVLSAAQMTSLQQTAMLGGDTTAKTVSYTLVAADAGTTVAMSNASATTITVNTGLFAAGDIVTIQNRGAGVCTITAGTATVSTANSLALSQNQGGVLYFTSSGAAIFFAFASSTTTTYSSWTPTLTNLTLGNGTMTGKFTQIGKFVNASLQLVFGSTTSVTGTMTFSVPTGASTANTALNTVIGNVRMLDAGIQNYLGMVQLSSSSAVILVAINASATYATVQNVNATVPFTWGTGDELQFSFSYEAV